MSDEPASKIQGFIKKHSCTYGFISSREALKNYGIRAFPTQFLVDAHGILAQGSVEGLLKDCDVPPPLEYSKKFDAAFRAIHAGDFKAAASDLAKLEKDTGKDGENAKALEGWIDEHGNRRLAEGDAAAEAGDVVGAKDCYTEVSKRWSPKSECAKTAKQKLSDLEKDKDAKKALREEKLFRQAQAAEDSGDKATAAALYQKCAKSAAGTKFADFCEKKASELK